MSIYSGTYAVYERLASTKMNAMVSSINAHTHNGIYGVQINFSDLAGSISAGQIPDDVIDSQHIADGAIQANHIDNNVININHIDQTSIHLDSDGYATYAPD